MLTKEKRKDRCSLNGLEIPSPLPKLSPKFHRNNVLEAFRLAGKSLENPRKSSESSEISSACRLGCTGSYSHTHRECRVVLGGNSRYTCAAFSRARATQIGQETTRAGRERATLLSMPDCLCRRACTKLGQTARSHTCTCTCTKATHVGQQQRRAGLG